MKGQLSIFTLMLALLFAGCSKNYEHITEDRLQEIADRPDESARDISIDGFLRFYTSLYIENGRGELQFNQTEAGDTSKHVQVRVIVNQSDASNTVRDPGESFTDKDLVIHLDDGGTADRHTKIRIYGKLVSWKSKAGYMVYQVKVDKMTLPQ